MGFVEVRCVRLARVSNRSQVVQGGRWPRIRKVIFRGNIWKWASLGHQGLWAPLSTLGYKEAGPAVRAWANDEVDPERGSTSPKI